MNSLPIIHHDVELRTAQIAASHPGWPCRKGCDDCCRRLANVPSITEPEWKLLRTALSELEPARRNGVRERIRALQGAVRPIVCPMLDTVAGVCLVYDARPVACRTYGFYADRDGLLGCERILEFSRQRDVIWGNYASIEDRVSVAGRRLSLSEWHQMDGRVR